MKRIGLLGGMSWESSLDYYRLINEGIRNRLGGLSSGKIILNSLNFKEIETLQHEGRWEELSKILITEAQNLEKSGAELIAIATNTMHKVAEDIQDNVTIPLIHIADAVGEKIKASNIDSVGLLGTKFTMEESFYRGRIEDKFQIRVHTPQIKDRDIIHKVIYEELCQGKVLNDSKKQFYEMISKLKNLGCSGVILGCTEIQMLIDNNIEGLNIFDSTKIHCVKIIEEMLIKD